MLTTDQIWFPNHSIPGKTEHLNFFSQGHNLKAKFSRKIISKFSSISFEKLQPLKVYRNSENLSNFEIEKFKVGRYYQGESENPGAETS